MLKSSILLIRAHDFFNFIQQAPLPAWEPQCSQEERNLMGETTQALACGFLHSRLCLQLGTRTTYSRLHTAAL